MATRPVEPTRKLVVVEESMLMSMSHNQSFLTAFPFLQALQKLKKRGCGSCRGGQAKATALTSAKQTLAGMGSSKKRELKKLLNAEQVRITYKNSGGKIINLTF